MWQLLIVPRVVIQEHLKRIIIMDNGYQYFKNIIKNLHSAMGSILMDG
jgi:hypothetical protein